MWEFITIKICLVWCLFLVFCPFLGYMGDLAVALEPPEHLRLASDDSLQSGEYLLCISLLSRMSSYCMGPLCGVCNLEDFITCCMWLALFPKPNPESQPVFEVFNLGCSSRPTDIQGPPNRNVFLCAVYAGYEWKSHLGFASVVGIKTKL